LIWKRRPSRNGGRGAGGGSGRGQMDWQQYYRERPVSLDRFINDIWDHGPFLVEITSAGQKSKEILEVGSGSGALSIFLSHLGYDMV